MHPLYGSQIFASPPVPDLFYFILYINCLSRATHRQPLLTWWWGLSLQNANNLPNGFIHHAICWMWYLHFWWLKMCWENSVFHISLPPPPPHCQLHRLPPAPSPHPRFKLVFPLPSLFGFWNVYSSTFMNRSWHYLGKGPDDNTQIQIWFSEWLCVNKCKGEGEEKEESTEISTESSKCLTKRHKELCLYVVPQAGCND